MSAKPKYDYGHPGTAGQERWVYMVWGALVGICKVDSLDNNPLNVLDELYRLTRTESHARGAIEAAAAAKPGDRVTAALRHLRALHKAV